MSHGSGCSGGYSGSHSGGSCSGGHSSGSYSSSHSGGSYSSGHSGGSYSGGHSGGSHSGGSYDASNSIPSVLISGKNSSDEDNRANSSVFIWILFFSALFGIFLLINLGATKTNHFSPQIPQQENSAL